MKTVVITVSLISFIWTVFVVPSQGLDLRKGSSWLYGAVSFLCGLTLVIAINGNLIEGLKVGAIFAFIILFTGVMMRRHKQETEHTIRSLLQEYENEEHPSLFGRLVKKLLDKYK